MLANLQALSMHRSKLTGSMPQGFTSFRLETFWWKDTQLCAPANEVFQAWLSVLLLAALVLACGESGPTESATPVATSVGITPSSVTLAALGETVHLTATALDVKSEPGG